MVGHMVQHHQVSQRQACKCLTISRGSVRHRPKKPDDGPVIEALQGLVAEHPAIGFWSCHHRLRRMGHHWNHKRVHRVYVALGMSIRRRARKRLPARAKQTLFRPDGPNQVWSLDFIHDSLWDGRGFRVLNILDDYNRESLAMEIDTSLPSLRVIRVLEQLKDWRGLPRMIRVDNGPEFISLQLEKWCKLHKVTLAFIEPGKPTQNSYVERFNGSLRRELLSAYVFRTLQEVRGMADAWRMDYNKNRPHQSLGYKAPWDLLA
jgi:putative transposase